MDKKLIDSRAIGTRIAEMRQFRGITQMQLAEKTGLSRVYIGYLEQGTRCGTILTYLDIVNALSYSLNDLVTDSPPTQDTELITELALTLTSCPEEEKASIIRIFREMLRMIRLIRTGNQNSE